MVIHRIEKTSNEIITKNVDASGVLDTGVTVSSAAVSATKRSDGTTDNSVIVDTTPSVSSPVVPVGFTGGTSGESYLVKVLITLSNSDVRAVYFVLRVTDPS